MGYFSSFDGVKLFYEDQGTGPATVLLHGFAADTAANWDRPGVVAALLTAGRRVITLDARGHGQSEKPHDPAAYEDDAMVKDASALLDHLAIEQADVVGYSMGAATTARLVQTEKRVRRAVLGGAGAAMASRTTEQMAEIADALEADDPDAVAVSPRARGFRQFADSTGADRKALAAIQRARRRWEETFAGLDKVTIPVLVISGDDDVLVGSPHELAGRFAHGRAAVVKGDHLSAVGDPAFATGVIAFLDEA